MSHGQALSSTSGAVPQARESPGRESPGSARMWLGTDIFGWTTDQEQTFAVLDAAFVAGIRFIDTADVYNAWVHDGAGGQSEQLIGQWLAARRVRQEIFLSSKVGVLGGLDDLRPATIRRALTGSLARLQTDHLDMYYAHRDDGGDLRATLATLDDLVGAGLIRAIGMSNFASHRVREALAICELEGLTRPVAVQPLYSMIERGYEHDLRDTAAELGLAVFPYSALAKGFLTGKYRRVPARTESAPLSQRPTRARCAGRPR